MTKGNSHARIGEFCEFTSSEGSVYNFKCKYVTRQKAIRRDRKGQKEREQKSKTKELFMWPLNRKPMCTRSISCLHFHFVSVASIYHLSNMFQLPFEIPNIWYFNWLMSMIGDESTNCLVSHNSFLHVLFSNYSTKSELKKIFKTKSKRYFKIVYYLCNERQVLWLKIYFIQ